MQWATAPSGNAAAEAARSLPADGAAVAEIDRQDIGASLKGDGEAYARLVRRYQQPIANYLWRFTRDRLQWEELVQDVFVEAYLSLSSFRGRSPWLHWLRRIATRRGYRHWRVQARRRAQRPLPAVSSTVLQQHREAVRAADAAALIHALLQKLPASDRLVLTLLHLEECPVAEAARLTGWPPALVRVRAHRARKRLKKLLDEMEAS